MKFSFANSDFRLSFSEDKLLWFLVPVFLGLWIFTFVGTTDIANWIIENALTFLSLLALFFTYKNRKLSDMSYLLIFLFMCLHVYGSKYTYAENPLGYWLQDLFHTQRNHYDRIVHFSFGFLLAYPMREIFRDWVKLSKRMSMIMPVEVTLSISGLYELIEWAVADIFFKAQGAAYLGTQGDIWDAQKDMFLATCGALLAILLIATIKKAFGKKQVEEYFPTK